MKTGILVISLFALPSVVFGQLRVDYDGTVRAGNTSINNTTFHINLYTEQNATSGSNIGIQGISKIVGNGSSCGLHGMAYNSGIGPGYGVVGSLDSGVSHGAGVLGGSMPIITYHICGKYAGYFYGNANVTGTLSAGSIVQNSDVRLKENIRPLSLRDESALEKVLDMNIVEYNYKKVVPSITIPDSLYTEEFVKASGIDPEQTHIGLIAQELQELYPNLVHEGQDGYLAVNYIELVPVLIRSIQELKGKMDDLKAFVDDLKLLYEDDILKTGMKPSGNNPIIVDGKVIGKKRVTSLK